jgi:peptidyl-prolyl cis-trans isomerase SurA
MKLLQKHMSKKLLPFTKLFITFTLLLFTTLAHSQAIIDKVVAQVGDEIILLSDIQNQRLQILQEGEAGNKRTDCAILEEFMNEKLLVNQAKIDSIEVADEMVNQEMERRLRYISGQIGSIEKLEEFYGKSVAQIKAEFFELIKKRIMAEQMKDQITMDVKVTPKEIKSFFTSLPKDSVPYINSKISVAQLVIYPEISADDYTKAQKKLQGIRDEINAGKLRFETAAALHSTDPGSKLQGGDLGWQTRGTMVPEFEATLFRLEKNELSEVFETQYGFHIIQLLDRKGDNYKCRHILVSAAISDAALEKAAITIDSIYNEIRQGRLSFEDAAAQFSDDDVSKNNGGKIVNPYSGDYLWDIQNINEIDPQMSRLVDQMTVGTYSEPSFYDNYSDQKQGLRIVKLIARTEPHIANLDSDRQLIEMAALNMKKQKVIDEWINTKIATSFIRVDNSFLSECDFKYNWVKEIVAED